jgi:hypothetical protein
MKKGGKEIEVRKEKKGGRNGFKDEDTNEAIPH